MIRIFSEKTWSEMSFAFILFFADCFGKVGKLGNFRKCRPGFFVFAFFFESFGFLGCFLIFFLFGFLFLFLLGLLKKLELPYRILRLCGGDMSFTAALCFDFEVYSEAQKRWLEVSSVSNFDTYQANRLKCRYRTAEKKTELCHTLNGSALALPRIVAALLENNQTPEGIRIPKAAGKVQQ
jgi:hypothetical protein